MEEKKKRVIPWDAANKHEILQKINPAAAKFLTRGHTTACVVSSSEHLCCVYYNIVFIIRLGPLGVYYLWLWLYSTEVTLRSQLYYKIFLILFFSWTQKFLCSKLLVLLLRLSDTSPFKISKYWGETGVLCGGEEHWVICPTIIYS